MTTFISIHEAKTIRASTVQDHNDCSPHITLEFDGDNYEAVARVTIYLPNPEFNQRLINVINAVAADIQADSTFTPHYPAVESDDEPAF